MGHVQPHPAQPVLPRRRYVGPALLVLPLFVISLVNLFVAGPPLKTVVLDSNGASYGASLPDDWEDEVDGLLDWTKGLGGVW